MRKDWILENDLIYPDAPMPDGLDSTFESMDLNCGRYMSNCAFTGAMMPLSLRGNESLCKVASSIFGEVSTIVARRFFER